MELQPLFSLILRWREAPSKDAPPEKALRGSPGPLSGVAPQREGNLV
jgi:hypothetical protein